MFYSLYSVINRSLSLSLVYGTCVYFAYNKVTMFSNYPSTVKCEN